MRITHRATMLAIAAATAIWASFLLYGIAYTAERLADTAQCSTDSECQRLCKPADADCDGGPQD